MRISDCSSDVCSSDLDDPLRPLAMLQAERVPAQDPEPPFTTVVDLQALDHRVAEASSQGKPVFVNFKAEWCVICKEIEREVLSAPQVQARPRDLVLVRADVPAIDAGNRAPTRATRQGGWRGRRESV